jgi:hypothetical protein
MVEFNLALCPALTKTRHVPRAPLPDRGVPSTGVIASRQRALTLLHRSYGLMRQTNPLLPPSTHLIRQVFAGCCQPLLGVAPSRHYLCNPCVGAWTPAPRCPSGAQTRFFPENIGLTLGVNRFGTPIRPCHATSTGKTFRGCSHFIMFRLPRLLGSQVAPTAAFQPGGRAVYTTRHSVGCPPRVVVSLRIRIG